MIDILSARSALAVVIGVAAMAEACSNGDDYNPESVSSFHFVRTITGEIDGEPLDSREEGWYQAPDSARIIGNAEYSALGLENIVIGSHAWERDASGWRAPVNCYNALSEISSILRFGGEHDNFTETRDGPTRDEEPTRLNRWEYEDAGRLLISASERSLGDSPSEIEALAATKEVFSDLTGTTETVVGKETGRIYSLVLTLDGSRMSRRSETVVDQYDGPVEIKSPLGVLGAPTREGASGVRGGCLDFGSDFPWIPVAAAALLGPILFMGASAFVWPRRPWAWG